MGKSYQRFLKTGLSLAPLGIAPRADNAPYFCTPRGASIFGWAGVDGIHFCFVRGWGEMVFAVSPMNGAGEYVHPIARDFDDLLRLLLACGDSAALEQAWQWDEERFAAFLRENPPSDEQRRTLDAIAARTGLAPMDAPWQYLHVLHTGFAYGKLKFTENFFDPDMNPDAPQPEQPWQVFFGGAHRSHAGTEQPLDVRFSWAGHEWVAAAAYSCAQGVVLDLLMRTEEDDFVRYLNKWAPTGEEPHLTGEERLRAELENPLELDFHARLTLNGRPLHMKHGTSSLFVPGEEHTADDTAADALAHYGLADGACWMLHRLSFLWATKRRCALRTLSLTLEHRAKPVPGACFTLRTPGDTARLTSPVTGKTYTLTAQGLTPQTLPARAFWGGNYDYPSHFTALTYTLSPAPDEPLTLIDADEGDRPVRKTAAPADAPTAVCSASIGIIGGADGPTALAVSAAAQQAACSALHFAPPARVRWRANWRERTLPPVEIALLQRHTDQ